MDIRKCRNEATKQRRLAIKEYWKIKSEDLKRKPRQFFWVFKPFLSDKGVRFDQDIKLNIKGDTVKGQINVSEILAETILLQLPKGLKEQMRT